MNWYTLTYKPKRNQNVAGSIDLYCKADSIEAARAIGEENVAQMNAATVVDRQNKPVQGVQWVLADVKLTPDRKE